MCGTDPFFLKKESLLLTALRVLWVVTSSGAVVVTVLEVGP